MLLYRPEAEVEWNKIVSDLGFDGVLTELAGLEKSSPIFQRVISLAESGKIL